MGRIFLITKYYIQEIDYTTLEVIPELKKMAILLDTTTIKDLFGIEMEKFEPF